MEASHDFGESPDAPQSGDLAPLPPSDPAAPADDPADPPVDPVPIPAASPSVNAPAVDPDPSGAAPDAPVDAPVLIVPPSPVPAADPPTAGAHLFDAMTLGRLGLAARWQKKQARLERLLAHIAVKGHITCPDTQILLEISKREAEVYLNELIAEGRLSRRGHTSDTEYWFVK